MDYLGELKPGMDYASLTGLAYRLVRLFWWEILQINPAQADLRTRPADRHDLAGTTSRSPATDTPAARSTRSCSLIRGLYRDLAEWAHDDPARWGIWVAPCPVPRAQSRAAAKDKRRQKARTQARTRVAHPAAAGVRRRRHQPAGLGPAAARRRPDHPEGDEFVVDGVRFARSRPPAAATTTCALPDSGPSVLHTEPGARPVPLHRGHANITKLEEDAFWAWALVETLRHTGIRIEELLELTQLSLRHYTPASTNTLVPLLHIVPSKTDAERLIPIL